MLFLCGTKKKQSNTIALIINTLYNNDHFLLSIELCIMKLEPITFKTTNEMLQFFSTLAKKPEAVIVQSTAKDYYLLSDIVAYGQSKRGAVEDSQEETQEPEIYFKTRYNGIIGLSELINSTDKVALLLPNHDVHQIAPGINPALFNLEVKPQLNTVEAVELARRTMNCSILSILLLGNLNYLVSDFLLTLAGHHLLEPERLNSNLDQTHASQFFYDIKKHFLIKQLLLGSFLQDELATTKDRRLIDALEQWLKVIDETVSNIFDDNLRALPRLKGITRGIKAAKVQYTDYLARGHDITNFPNEIASLREKRTILNDKIEAKQENNRYIQEIGFVLILILIMASLIIPPIVLSALFAPFIVCILLVLCFSLLSIAIQYVEPVAEAVGGFIIQFRENIIHLLENRLKSDVDALDLLDNEIAQMEPVIEYVANSGAYDAIESEAQVIEQKLRHQLSEIDQIINQFKTNNSQPHTDAKVSNLGIFGPSAASNRQAVANQDLVSSTDSASLNNRGM